jgi:hypothetical protein
MKTPNILFCIALLCGGCATKGGWPCWKWQKNTDQKNAAALYLVPFLRSYVP